MVDINELRRRIRAGDHSPREQRARAPSRPQAPAEAGVGDRTQSTGIGLGAIIGWCIALLVLINVVSCVGKFINGVSRPSTQPQEVATAPPAQTSTEPYSPPYSANPSFPCSGDLNWQKRAICSDDGLAAQDRELAALSSRVSTFADPEELRRINDHWSAEWDRCGGSGSIPGCLGWVYREWIAELGNVTAPVQQQSADSSDAPQERADSSDTGAASDAGESQQRAQKAASEQPAQGYGQPGNSIICILPSGEEVRLSFDECRRQGGVVDR